MKVSNMQAGIYKLLVLLAAILFYGCVEETFVEPKLYGNLSGVVLSAKEKQPLANAIVRISPSGKTLETDANGKFRVDSLLVDSYSVQTSLDKYRSDVTSIEIEEGKLTNITVYLAIDNNQNKPPLKAKIISPENGSSGNELKTVLKWQKSDPENDTLRFNVFLFKEGQPANTMVAKDIWTDSLMVSNLGYNTTYFWQVVTMDSTNAPVYGEVWSFKTREASNLPYFYSRKIDNNYQIFASDSIETIQITKFGGNWRPTLSPNRQKLAFISNINTVPHIFVSDLTGKFITKATVVPIAGISTIDLSFCWSPDGTELLYPNFDKLYAVKTDGTGLRIVAQAPYGRFFAGCDWTGQGNKIVARITGSSVYDNELHLINPATGVLSNLISGRPGRMSNPDFSPDGKKVVFALDLDNFQNNEGRQYNSNIQLVDIQNGVTSNISSGKELGTNDLEPRFSPNGARIIFTNTSNDGYSEKSIFSIYISGSERTQIIKNGEMPEWR